MCTEYCSGIANSLKLYGRLVYNLLLCILTSRQTLTLSVEVFKDSTHEKTAQHAGKICRY